MASIYDLKGQKLEIKYPIFWEYKIILDKNEDEAALISELLNDRDHQLKPSKTSSKGSFKSFNLSVLVYGDEERLELFSLLKKRCKFVL